jgi:hypothetical protein
MNEKLITITAAIGLIIGGILGMVGSMVPSPYIRGLAWGIDGLALILATALLTLYYFRKGQDIMAAGFLVFAIGEALILSCSGIDLNSDLPAFGSGAGLWALSLFLISFQNTYPIIIRGTGLIAALLFSVVAFQIFTGHPVNALTKPLPFFAYPVFVVTIFGWAWTLLKNTHHT